LDTKWKKWTALKPVKILSFILILGSCFAVAYTFAQIVERFDVTGVDIDSVLTDDTGKRNFFDRNMQSAYFNATLVMFYGSEEQILAGNHIRWEGDMHSSSLRSTRGDTMRWVELPISTLNEIRAATESGKIAHENGRNYYDYKDEHEGDLDNFFGPDIGITQNNIIMWEQEAIEWQLNTFRSALNTLRTTQGLVFSIQIDSEESAGTVAVESNFDHFVHHDMPGWFRAQPVYYIQVGQYPAEISHEGRLHSYEGRMRSQTINWAESFLSSDEHLLLAFTYDVVVAHNEIFVYARNAYVRDIAIGAASLIFAVVLVAILFFGAGRRFGRPKEVYFQLIDKPFLDIALAAAAGWSAFMLFLTNELALTLLQRNNLVSANRAAFITIIIAAIILVATPLIFLMLSFAKRIKAGRFWKHTLVYTLLSFVFRWISRGVRALWAGRTLTVKVALIALGIFLVLIIVGALAADLRNGFIVFFMAVICTTGITLLVFKYAHRIHRLEQGALAFRDGNYESPIAAGGGELGSIADSINNMGVGVNHAVEQRMKSERLKAELITNVSHDIRTPLTSIITYTDLLKHEGLDCEKAPEYLDVLIQKSQRLKTLTDELFEASKAATGNIDVSITELDMVALISQVMGEMDSAVKSSGLDIRFSHPDSLLVQADGRLMWRVVENLLSNVFKYALAGSRVYIDVSPQEPPHSRIEFKNISARELNIDPSELTERFKRGDESRADGGSGLGLSIVQSFVEAQGGEFEITVDGDLFKATVWI